MLKHTTCFLRGLVPTESIVLDVAHVMDVHAFVVRSQAAKAFRIEAVRVVSSKLNIDGGIRGQHLLESSVCLSRPERGVACVCEAKDNVLGSVPVQMGEQLLEAEGEHDGESGVVRLEEDENAVEDIYGLEAGQNVGHILLVLCSSTRVSNTRRVDEPYESLSNLHCVMFGPLGSRLALRAVSLIQQCCNMSMVASIWLHVNLSGEIDVIDQALPASCVSLDFC